MKIKVGFERLTVDSQIKYFNEDTAQKAMQFFKETHCFNCKFHRTQKGIVATYYQYIDFLGPYEKHKWVYCENISAN